MKENNAEGGVNGVTPTPADVGSGDPYDVVSKGANSILEYTTVLKAHGSKAVRIANHSGVSEQNYFGFQTAGGADWYGRFYYICDVTPTATTRIVQMRLSTGGVAGSMWHSTGNALTIRHGNDSTLYTFANLIPALTVYRIEHHVVVNNTVSVNFQARLYAGDSVVPIEDSGVQVVTATSALATWDLIRFGGGVTAQGTYPSATGYQVFDDNAAFANAWLGPVPGAAARLRALMGVGV